MRAAAEAAEAAAAAAAECVCHQQQKEVTEKKYDSESRDTDRVQLQIFASALPATLFAHGAKRGAWIDRRPGAFVS